MPILYEKNSNLFEHTDSMDKKKPSNLSKPSTLSQLYYPAAHVTCFEGDLNFCGSEKVISPWPFYMRKLTTYSSIQIQWILY